MADRGRKDIDNQHNERTDNRPGQDTDERGEIHMHAPRNRDVNLKYRKGCRRAECGNRDAPRVWLPGAQEKQGCADHEECERPPDKYPEEGK